MAFTWAMSSKPELCKTARSLLAASSTCLAILPNMTQTSSRVLSRKAIFSVSLVCDSSRAFCNLSTPSDNRCRSCSNSADLC
ncbi:MAG: hypothetical protein ACD_55C00082G0001 [uncultured bacterium]|nr:MAG: hypothetical protein ACD_55C00082G0001 [uncultured bacterium]